MSESRRTPTLDLYELLEVSPKASRDVIRAAYRALARNSHPDRNATLDADTRIRQINAAYAVLSDPARRACYDLECLRAQRRTRTVTPTPTPSRPGVSSPGLAGTRVLAAREAVRQRPAEERFSMFRQLAILLVLATGVALLLVVLVWSGLDAAQSNGLYTAPIFEVTGR